MASQRVGLDHVLGITEMHGDAKTKLITFMEVYSGVTVDCAVTVNSEGT